MASGKARRLKKGIKVVLKCALVRRAKHQRHCNRRSREVVCALNHLEKDGRFIKRNAHQVTNLRHGHALIRVGGERELGAEHELLRGRGEGEF